MSDTPPPSRQPSPRPPHGKNQRQRRFQRPEQKTKAPDDPLLQAVLKAAEETLAALGPGMPEEFYRTVFGDQLQKAGVACQVRPRTVLRHRDKVADEFTCDFLCSGQVLVNVHADAGEFSHEQVVAAAAAQKHFNARHALLLDFGREEPAHRRLHLSPDSFPSVAQDEMARGVTVEKADELRVAMLCRSLLRIGRAQGLGYGEKTYLGLLRVEFAAESLDFREEPVVSISAGGKLLGDVKLRHCMEIQRSGVLLVTAQREGIRNLDRAWLSTALRQLHRPWGVVAHFGRRHFEWRWVQAGPAADRRHK